MSTETGSDEKKAGENLKDRYSAIFWEKIYYIQLKNECCTNIHVCVKSSADSSISTATKLRFMPWSRSRLDIQNIKP